MSRQRSGVATFSWSLTCCDSMRSKMLSKPRWLALLWLPPGSNVDSSSSEGPTLTSSGFSRAVLEPSGVRPPWALPVTLQWPQPLEEQHNSDVINTSPRWSTKPANIELCKTWLVSYGGANILIAEGAMLTMTGTRRAMLTGPVCEQALQLFTHRC